MPHRVYRPLPQVPFDCRIWYFIYSKGHLHCQTARNLSNTSRGLQHLALYWLDLAELLRNARASRNEHARGILPNSTAAASSSSAAEIPTADES